MYLLALKRGHMYQICMLSDPSQSVTFDLTSNYVLSTFINSGTKCKKYAVCNLSELKTQTKCLN